MTIRFYGPRRHGDTDKNQFGLRASVTPWLVAVCVAALMVTNAEAQSTFAFRGFVDGGSTTFTAKKSFTAILGKESGLVYGGGVEAVAKNVYLNVRASRFQKTGERVFIFEEQQFRLGIPETITITPIEVNVGYRFNFGSWVVPYAGLGGGWHKFTDASTFNTDSENVKKTFKGYQVTGGAEFRLSPWLGAAAEAAWSRVPNALGQDDDSVAKMFDESDLGGTTFRVKFVIGR